MYLTNATVLPLLSFLLLLAKYLKSGELMQRHIDVASNGSMLIDTWLYLRFYGNVTLAEIMEFVKESQLLRIRLSCFIDHRLKGLPRAAVEDFPPSDVEEFCRAMELPTNCKLPAEARDVFTSVKESYQDSDVTELTSRITAFLKQSLSYTVEEATASKAKALFVPVPKGCHT